MRRQAGAPLFYKERLGTKSPPHPTRLRRPTYGLWWLRLDLTEQSPGLFDPQGEGFGRGKHSCRVSNPLPPNGLARQGKPRRVSPPAGGERKSNHVLTGSAGQNILLTPRVPASPARVGVHPPILGGASHQAGNLTPPYSALPNEAQTPLAPPKILTARRSASPPDPPASAAPPQPGGSGPGSGPGSRWPSGPGGRRGPRCWSFSRSSPGPLGWTGWS